MSLVGTIIDSVISGGASVISGGITGLGGIAVQRYFDLKNAQTKIQADAQNQAHEIEIKKLDLEAAQSGAASSLKLAESEAVKAEVTTDGQSFTAAITSEPQRFTENGKLTDGQNWLLVILDCVRGLVRPGLTAYLAVLTSLIYWQSIRVMTKEGMSMDPEHAYALVNECMSTVLYLFTTSTLFFFGTRNKASEARARKSF
jgi:Tfp pilus assembly major pilin PilA